MALTTDQRSDAWNGKFQAGSRSLYFGQLASAYMLRRRLICRAGLLLSFGAVATLIAKLPAWVPVLLAVCSAISAAYSVAGGLDKRIASIGVLCCMWRQLSTDYGALWNHWYADDAESALRELARRADEASSWARTGPVRGECSAK